MNKYILLYIMAFIIEICSTMYISAVTNNNMFSMFFWSAISPFLSLPFLKYQIEATNWRERIHLATCYGIGYGSGAIFVSYFINL